MIGHFGDKSIYILPEYMSSFYGDNKFCHLIRKLKKYDNNYEGDLTNDSNSAGFVEFVFTISSFTESNIIIGPWISSRCFFTK